MPRAARRTGWLIAALAMTTAAGAAGTAAPAYASPPRGSYPPAIEDLAPYDPQTTCNPVSQPGTIALRSLLTSAYAGTGDLGIVRACDIGGVSEHKEGRAWDWALSAANPVQDAQARDLFAWMFAPDAQGNDYAMARRLGIMYMIYNEHIWSASQADAGWRPYTGADPHTNHVHISLSRPGAAKATTYWGGTPPTIYSPTSAPVLAKWRALGGSTGVLGDPVRGEYAVAGGRAQDYAYGRVYWSSATGAAAVVGAIAARYDALRGSAGPLGLPVTDELDVPGISPARVSRFQNGRIYWSPASGVGSVVGAIATRHLELGGPTGSLGLPVDDEKAAGAGRVSTFQGGRLVWGATTGVHAVLGAVGVGWDRQGGASGPLGLPVGEETAGPLGSRYSVFQNGVVVWSAATGVAAVQGAIAQRWNALGSSAGPLGLPLADEAAAGSGRVSVFTGGRLVWGPSSGTQLVTGAIGVGWDRLGGANGPLGLPVTDEVSAGGAARTNRFQGGAVYWSPATGLSSVYGAIATHYVELGGPAALGLPLGDEVGVPGGRMSLLQGGRMYWGPASGAHAVVGAIGIGYDRAGGPGGVLGLPVDDEVAAGTTGRSSAFQGGRVLWSPATGVHAVTGGALAALDAEGGVLGPLGFPVGDRTAVTPAASVQLFEGGRAYVTAAGGHSVRGALLATYLMLGGPTGPLGLPVSDEYATPGARRSDFERGWLSFDTTTGAVTRH